MGFHTFPEDRVDALDDPARYRYCSLEELHRLIDPGPDDTVVDLGAGTGFYAVDIAEGVARLVALDLQETMVSRLADRDAPDSLAPVLAAAGAPPVCDGTVDVAYSTMTFHEYASQSAHEAVWRMLKTDGRLVTVDWSSNGTGESGPPLDERYDLTDAVEQLQSADFTIDRADRRRETFVLVARRA